MEGVSIMNKKFDYLVFIGRFQPFHNGHLKIIHEALSLSKNLIILIGSANVARSPKNPFTFSERKEMITNTLVSYHNNNINIFPLNDYPYNNDLWIAETNKIIEKCIKDTGGNVESRIGLIGYSKDASSFYLKMFPNFESVDVPTQYSTLNSTDIRNEYLNRFYHIPTVNHCPAAVVSYLTAFVHTQEFKWLVNESDFYKEYHKEWGKGPFITSDAVVTQAGHVLLVTRKHQPGKGLLALPGGFVKPNQTFREAAIAELKEETRIQDHKGEIPPAILDSYIKSSKIFDDPHRSIRGRIVTNAFHFVLPPSTKMFKVKGDDDAEFAHWYKIGNLNPTEFFEDHYSILSIMLGLVTPNIIL